MYKREAVVSGQFYPADKNELSRLVTGYLGKPDITGDITGIVSPHAGYAYSGAVAGKAFGAVQNGDYQAVIVLAPSHRYPFNGASVIPDGLYVTPLAETSIDSSITRLLIDDDMMVFIPAAHEMEHSVEVQLPFIQTIFPALPVIPVLIGSQKYQSCIAIGEKIGDVIRETGRKILIIISTDLSHYLSYDDAKETDTRLCRVLESFSTENLRQSIERGESSACGYGPLLAGFAALKKIGATSCSVIDYKNSGDTAGPTSQVVGYCAAVITREDGSHDN